TEGDNKLADDILLPIFTEVKAAATSSAPVQKAPPKPETPVRKPVRKAAGQMRSPSIKDALAGKFKEDKLSAKEQHEAYMKINEIREFTQEMLSAKWNEFVNKLEDRPNLKATLSRTPQLESEFQLILEIDNSVQEDLINTIRPELVAWLRKELRNSNIQLVTKITEVEKERLIYTDSEKYMEMLKVNPRLELLKQKFKLDFE
ncbi:MAG TPA: hypothetical protein VFD91_02105, partial [Mariniphaga sp.]|nr:hypothetical protein [Mariniphaga sp.]